MDYNNKRFKIISNSDNGELESDLVFHYKQDGRILTCEYKGGSIIKGHLIGLVDNEGNISMSYHQVNEEGELRSGVCESTCVIMNNGKVRLNEAWEWTSGDRSKGSSVLEEI